MSQAENELKLIELIYEFREWENCLIDGVEIGSFNALSITAGIYKDFWEIIRSNPDLAKKYAKELLKMRKYILIRRGRAV